MDLVTSNTTHAIKLGMDGLVARQQAIASNIANVTTPGYRRQEVSFEGQLNEMLEDQKNKDYVKGLNSIQYNPKSISEVSPQRLTKEGYNILTPEQKAYLNSNSFSGFGPQILSDNYSGAGMDGNNVELEREMMDMSKTGTKFLLLSNLERREYTKVSQAIKGE